MEIMLSSRENKYSCPLVHICRAWSRYENAETTGNPQHTWAELSGKGNPLTCSSAVAIAHTAVCPGRAVWSVP